MKTLSEYAKSIFFLLIFLQFVPPLLKALKEQYGTLLKVHTNVGKINFDTAIMDSTFYAKHLKAFFKDPDIKAILLSIESPGGAAGSCQALFNEIQELKKRYPKPIICLSENMCTSGAYYIACATDKIICTRSALVGSIGTTLTTLFNLKELAQNWHINTETISAGAYKNATNQFTTLTPEQKTMLQSVADSSYEQFTADVAKARKISLTNKDEWANGKIFTGEQALALHLIDMNGSYSQAVATLKSMAPIEGSINWIEPQEKLSFLDRLTGASNRPFVKELAGQLVSLFYKQAVNIT